MSSNDAIDMVIADHRLVDGLFEQAMSGTDVNMLTQLQQRIISELSVHAAVEEMFLYPTARRMLKSDQLVDHSIDEHQQMKQALAAWEKLAPADPMWRTTLQKIVTDVRHHVMEEESKVLPAMRQATTPAQRENMASIMSGLKKVAPSRPHPEAPQTMPGAAISGMMNSFWDGLSKMATGTA